VYHHPQQQQHQHPVPSQNVFAAAVAAANAQSAASMGNQSSHSRSDSASTTATGLTSGIGTPIVGPGGFGQPNYATASLMQAGLIPQQHPGTSRTPIPTSSPALATAVPMRRFASPTRMVTTRSPSGSPPRVRRDSD
jgi:hypothetical protein